MPAQPPTQQRHYDDSLVDPHERQGGAIIRALQCTARPEQQIVVVIAADVATPILPRGVPVPGFMQTPTEYSWYAPARRDECANGSAPANVTARCLPPVDFRSHGV